jgi:uncharacterized protein YjlB
MAAVTGLHLAFLDAAGSTTQAVSEPTGLQWQTKLPGGLFLLSADWTDTLPVRATEYQRRRATACELTDDGGEVLFSGRLQQPTLGRAGSTLQFTGWFGTLRDSVFGYRAALTESPLYVDDLLRQLVRQVGAHLDQDVSLIQHNPLDLLAGGAGDDLNALDMQYADQVIADLCNSYPDTSGAVWSAAIWGDRKLTYAPRAIKPTHVVSQDDLDPQYQLTLKLDWVKTSVLIKYVDGNRNQRVAGPYTNRETADRLGYSAVGVVTLPSRLTFSTAALDAIAALYLSVHSRPQQQVSGLRVLPGGAVTTVAGHEVTAASVRAGDVLYVPDLAVGEDDWPGEADELRSFAIGSTSFNGATGALELTADSSVPNLDHLFARFGQALSAR